MKTKAPLINDAHRSSGAHPSSTHPSSIHPSSSIQEQDLQPQERFEDELIMNLERDQFVAETSRPVPRAALSARATAGLWLLRVFVVLVSMMVIYTFVDQLH
ncbi:MAG TPA: hypothetical protein VII53_04955 [Solirubrobacteraceae bacterium]